MIFELDLMLRTATATLLACLAVLLLRDHRRSTAGLLAALLALSSIAYAVVSTSSFSIQPALLRTGLITISSGAVVVLWTFAQAVFDDDFTPRWWHGAAWAGLVSLSLIACLTLNRPQTRAIPILGLGLDVAGVIFLVLVLVQTISSWSADLVEGRRRIRIFIVIAATLHAAVHAGLRLSLSGGEPSSVNSLISAATLACIVVIVAWSLLRTTGDDIFPVSVTAPILPQAPIASEDTAPPDLIARIEYLMTDERLYRREGMTIGVLAMRLAIPEYRLRRLINQGLGYRNFNAFLNKYRIDEVRAALADPAQIDVPITTIALDAGFQSLGPFNRAFKSASGVTPTQFKRLCHSVK